MAATQLNAQNQVLVALRNFEQQIGDVVDIPVNISTSGLSVATYRIDVLYDQSVLKILSLEGQSPWVVFSNIEEAGVMKIAGLNMNGQHNDFTGANLQFKVIGLPGQLSYLEIFVFRVTDRNNVDVLHEYSNGQVAINCADQIHIGNPQFHHIDKGVFRASLSLSSDVIVDGNFNTVQYRAGETINLTPDFEVKAGSAFEAEIRDCQDLNMNYRSRVDRYQSKTNRSTSSTKQSNAPAQNVHRMVGVPKLGKAIEIKDDAH